jgi:hypothetical protein
MKILKNAIFDFIKILQIFHSKEFCIVSIDFLSKFEEHIFLELNSKNAQYSGNQIPTIDGNKSEKRANQKTSHS